MSERTVPVEPTEEMIDVGAREGVDAYHDMVHWVHIARRIYTAMLAAAPPSETKAAATPEIRPDKPEGSGPSPAAPEHPLAKAVLAAQARRDAGVGIAGDSEVGQSESWLPLNAVEINWRPDQCPTFEDCFTVDKDDYAQLQYQALAALDLEAKLAEKDAKIAAFRDTILHERGAIAENGMTNDQINDVLSELDDAMAELKGKS